MKRILTIFLAIGLLAFAFFPASAAQPLDEEIASLLSLHVSYEEREQLKTAESQIPDIQDLAAVLDSSPLVTPVIKFRSLSTEQLGFPLESLLRLSSFFYVFPYGDSALRAEYTDSPEGVRSYSITRRYEAQEPIDLFGDMKGSMALLGLDCWLEQIYPCADENGNFFCYLQTDKGVFVRYWSDGNARDFSEAGFELACIAYRNYLASEAHQDLDLVEYLDLYPLAPASRKLDAAVAECFAAQIQPEELAQLKTLSHYPQGLTIPGKTGSAPKHYSIEIFEYPIVKCMRIPDFHMDKPMKDLPTSNYFYIVLYGDEVLQVIPKIAQDGTLQLTLEPFFIYQNNNYTESFYGLSGTMTLCDQSCQLRSIQVYNDTARGGTLLYLQTDKGVYVRYCSYYGILDLPEAEFRALCEEYYGFLNNDDYMFLRSVDLISYWNERPYTPGGNDKPWLVPLIAALAVAACAGTAAVLFRRQKRGKAKA